MSSFKKLLNVFIYFFYRQPKMVSSLTVVLQMLSLYLVYNAFLMM